EREFSRSPSDTLRAYLCWFRVRAPTTLLEDFLGSVESENFGTKISLPITVQDEHLSGFSYSSSLPAWAHTSIRAHSLSYCVPPLLIAVMRWYRNINLLSIVYALQPRLRSRLTLSGRAFLRKP